jgi:hypothetical protein
MWLSREQVKEIVRTSLSSVADFEGDIEQFEFENFHNFHKIIFLTSLRQNIVSQPYNNSDGSLTYDRYYDVILNDSVFASWNSISDSINYIVNNQFIMQRPIAQNKIKMITKR